MRKNEFLWSEWWTDDTIYISVNIFMVFADFSVFWVVSIWLPWPKWVKRNRNQKLQSALSTHRWKPFWPKWIQLNAAFYHPSIGLYFFEIKVLSLVSRNYLAPPFFIQQYANITLRHVSIILFVLASLSSTRLSTWSRLTLAKTNEVILRDTQEEPQKLHDYKSYNVTILRYL